MNLIKELRAAWKLWSVKLAALTAILAAIVASNQTIALGLVYFLPEGPWRVVAGVGIGLVVFVIPTVVRLVKQGKSDGE